MIMNSVHIKWTVVLFLMSVMYLVLTANTSSWISARSTPRVSWKTCRFSSYGRFSSYWSWG